MKIGDLIFDYDYGMTGIVLNIMNECKELGNLPVNECYYDVMFENGMIESVCDIEVQPLEE